MREPNRTPFNPHGFTDAEHLFTFLSELIKSGSVEPKNDEGELIFSNKDLFLNIDWAAVNQVIDDQTYTLKLDLEVGIKLFQPSLELDNGENKRISHQLTVFLSDETIFIAAAKSFNPASGLVNSINFEIPLRVLHQNNYYNLPLED